eukprot:Nk52_evm44s215 gene=Nk52_evmTU44s215
MKRLSCFALMWFCVTVLLVFCVSGAWGENKDRVSVVDCSVEDKENGVTYDLTELMLDNINWKAADSAEKNEVEFDLNVCKVVNLVDRAKNCPPNTAICMMFKNSTEEPRSLGYLSEGPKLINGSLSLEYRNGSNCKGFQSRTVINFVCGDEATIGTPVYVEETVDCAFIFEWKTRSACSFKKVKNETHAECKVADQNGVEFDLSPLGRGPDADPYEIKKEPFVYKFNICKALPKNTVCGSSKTDDVASCELKPKNESYARAIGKTSNELLIDPITDITSVEYDQGDGCKTTVNFICPKGGGPSPAPEYVRRDGDCKHFFNFPTELVCKGAAETISCVALGNSGKKMYDLSSLVAIGNPRVADVEVDLFNNTKGKVYVNVCKAAGKNFCGGKAGICFSDGKNVHKNLGVPKNSPEVDSKGALTFTAGDGDKVCDNDKSAVSVIHFVCAKSGLSAPILKDASMDTCTFIFVWETPLACSEDFEKSDDCVIDVPSEGYSLDLNVLRDYSKNVDFSLDYNNTRYMINVCGPLKEKDSKCKSLAKDAGVCKIEIDPKAMTTSKPEIIGLATKKVYYANGVIYMKYKGREECMKVNGKTVYKTSILTILCDEKGMSSPEFSKKEGECEFHFTWKTSAACSPSAEEVECSITDSKGNEIDLSPLSSKKGYLAESPKKKSSFYFNVCKGLNRDECPANVGGCEYERDTKKKISLGRVRHPLRYNEEKKLLAIRYTDGAKCGKDLKERKQTVIEFVCNDKTVMLNDDDDDDDDDKVRPERAPSVEIVDDCLQTVVWQTRHACPVTRDEEEVNKSCVLDDKVSGHKFDLTSLYRAQGYTIDENGVKIVFTVCNKLKSTLCKVPDAAGCADLGNDKYQLLGNFEKRQLSYHGGELSLEFPGGPKVGKCASTSMDILFTCTNTGVEEPPKLVYAEKSKKNFCSVTINFPTPLSCAPVEQDCLVEDKSTGISYDFGLLADMDFQALKTVGSESVIEYYLSVCKPLRMEGCPKESGACKKQLKGGNVGLGKIVGKPVVKKGQVSVEYTNGDTCQYGAKRRKSVIYFICGSGLGFPHFKEESGCATTFVWPTSVVCQPHGYVIGSGCKAKNPDTKESFNFDQFSSQKPPAYEQKDGSLISISVCGTLSEKCGKTTSSACLRKKDGTTVNLGVFSGTMDYVSKGVFDVHFKGGECKANKNGLRLSIVCDQFAIDDTLIQIFADSARCVYVFEYRTRKACDQGEPWGECMILDSAAGVGYDLSLLTRDPDDPYSIAVKEGKILLNICNVVSKCQNPSDGSCLDAGSHNIRSLGTTSKEVQFQSTIDRTVVLKYRHGMKCGDTGKDSMTIIQFVCKKDALLGSPKVTRVSENYCKVDIEWETSLVCSDLVVPVVGGDCSVKNPFTGTVYDLKKLSKKKDNYIAETPEGKKYNVNICDPVVTTEEGCKDAGVCLDGRSLGQYNRTIVYSDMYISIKYVSKEKCPSKVDEYKTATIILTCDPSSKNNELSYISSMGKDGCDLMFSFRTSYACEPKTSSANPVVDVIKKLNGPGWIAVSFLMVVIISIGGIYIWKNPCVSRDFFSSVKSMCRRFQCRCPSKTNIFGRRREPAVRFEALGSRDILLDDSDDNTSTADVGLLEL